MIDALVDDDAAIAAAIAKDKNNTKEVIYAELSTNN